MHPQKKLSPKLEAKFGVSFPPTQRIAGFGIHISSSKCQLLTLSKQIQSGCDLNPTNIFFKFQTSYAVKGEVYRIRLHFWTRQPAWWQGSLQYCLKKSPEGIALKWEEENSLGMVPGFYKTLKVTGSHFSVCANSHHSNT